MYEISDEDIYEMMKREISNFDSSDYPADNIFGIPQTTKKVGGLIKNESYG